MEEEVEVEMVEVDMVEVEMAKAVVEEEEAEMVNVVEEEEAEVVNNKLLSHSIPRKPGGIAMAEEEGYRIGFDPDVGELQIYDRVDNPTLPGMMAIDNSLVQPADRYQVLPGAGVDAGFGIEAGAYVEPLRQVVVDVGTGSVGNDDGSVVVTDNGNVGDGLGDGSNGAIAGANDGELLFGVLFGMRPSRERLHYNSCMRSFARTRAYMAP